MALQPFQPSRYVRLAVALGDLLQQRLNQPTGERAFDLSHIGVQLAFHFLLTLNNGLHGGEQFLLALLDPFDFLSSQLLGLLIADRLAALQWNEQDLPFRHLLDGEVAFLGEFL